jgi:hypothetical protein
MGCLQNVCVPLIDQISLQNPVYSYEVIQQQITAQKVVKNDRLQGIEDAVNHVREVLSKDMLRNLDLASEKGASVWLTCLPVEEFGFCLHKRAFLDALSLRYGWPPANVPTSCPCGTPFTICHVLSCPRGGFPSLRHNDIRDITAHFLTEVCNNVRIEPELQPVPKNIQLGASANITEGAHLDVSANGLWGGRYEKNFIDVRVFNPHSVTARSTSISACYIKHEKEKKRQYALTVLQLSYLHQVGWQKKPPFFISVWLHYCRLKEKHHITGHSIGLDVIYLSVCFVRPYSVSGGPDQVSIVQTWMLLLTWSSPELIHRLLKSYCYTIFCDSYSFILFYFSVTTIVI